MTVTHYILTICEDCDSIAVENRYAVLGWTVDGRMVVEARAWMPDGYTGPFIDERIVADPCVIRYADAERVPIPSPEEIDDTDAMPVEAPHDVYAVREI